MTKIVSEYDQEIPQSQTADKCIFSMVTAREWLDPQTFFFKTEDHL